MLHTDMAFNTIPSYDQEHTLCGDDSAADQIGLVCYKDDGFAYSVSLP